jgi:hypothetical protein
MAVRVGGKTETIILRTAFTVIAILAVCAMFAPGLLHRIEPDVFADSGQ